MKLKKDANTTDFINAAKKCGHDLYFETSEGDRLNLKSTLSDYIFAASAVDPEFLKKGKIVCEDEQDYKVIADYVEEG